MRRKGIEKIPPRPIHLHAEPLWAEHDGVGAVSGEVRLYTELEDAEPSFTVKLRIPSHATRATVRLVAEDSLDIETEPRTGDCAVFTVDSRDIAANSDVERTEYERIFMHGRVSRRISRRALLAWALLRVAEYVRARVEGIFDIALLDLVEGGECARLAVMHDDTLVACQMESAEGLRMINNDIMEGAPL